MIDDKNTADGHRMLLRMPGGLKERLQSRAKASGRSMNAEAIAILEQALGDPSEVQVETLAREGLTLLARQESHRVDLQLTEERLEAIRSELADALGSVHGEADPLDYMLRVRLRRQKVARDKKAEQGI